MNIRTLIACTATLVLAACASYDGDYSPSCPTFVANVVQLEKGAFTWTRLSDEVVIGDDGQPVNPYPDFPKKGSYEVDAGVVHMTTTEGKKLPPMYFHEAGEQLYLLSEVEHRSLGHTGEPPDCALLRVVPPGKN